MVDQTDADVFDGDDMLAQPVLQRSDSLPADWDGYEPFGAGKGHDVESVAPLLSSHKEEDWKDFAREELWAVGRMALPVAGMNFVWLMRTIVSTIFLGQLGRLALAGG